MAAALDQAADNATLRGGTAAAATALALAADLSPPGPARTGRLARAGQALFLAGRRQQADQIVDQLLRTGNPDARTDALLLQANLAIWSDHVADAPPQLWAAFDELTSSSPDAAATVGIQLTVILGSLGQLHEMSLVSLSRIRGLNLSDDKLKIAAQCAYALSSVFLGDPRPLADLEHRLPPDRALLVLGPNSAALGTLAEAFVFRRTP